MPRAWIKGLLAVEHGERPWQIRDELGISMLENFGVFRHAEKMEKQVEVIAGSPEADTSGVSWIEDKGDVFNSDLTQAIELGYLLQVAECMLQAGIAREGEPRRALTSGGLPRPATTRTSSSTR